MTSAFSLKRGDTGPDLVALLSDEHGLVDPTGKTARFLLRPVGGSTVLGGAMDVVDVPHPSNPATTVKAVRYRFQPADTAVAGDFQAEIELGGDGTVRTFPTTGYLAVTIQPDID